MIINPTYKKLTIHEKINARSATLINRQTGLTPKRKIGRFEHQFKLNHVHKEFHDQPFCFSKHIECIRKYVNTFESKF